MSFKYEKWYQFQVFENVIQFGFSSQLRDSNRGLNKVFFSKNNSSQIVKATIMWQFNNTSCCYVTIHYFEWARVLVSGDNF